MTKCSACGRKVRNTKHAIVLHLDGARNGRVCVTCVRTGVLVVAAVAHGARLGSKMLRRGGPFDGVVE